MALYSRDSWSWGAVRSACCAWPWRSGLAPVATGIRYHRQVGEAGHMDGGGLPSRVVIDGELDRKGSGAPDEDLESDAEPRAVTGPEGGRTRRPDRAAWCP